MSKTVRTAAVLVALVLVVAGAVGASATDSRAATGRLTGCRNTTTGTLDQVMSGLLPMGGACGAGEVAVTWSKRGPRGPQGEIGATGTPGPPGAPGVSGWERTAAVSVDNSDYQKFAYAECSPGKKVIGGGGLTTLSTTHVISSWPSIFATGWAVSAVEASPTSENWTVTAYAICVTALP